MPPSAPPVGTNGAVAPSHTGGESVEHEHEKGAQSATRNGEMSIPLPGSAAWNEAPPQPGYVRPALGGGWQRGPRIRR